MSRDRQFATLEEAKAAYEAQTRGAVAQRSGRDDGASEPTGKCWLLPARTET